MTVNPHRITVALDRAKLFGPSADAKLGAHEPDLDDWEAGRKVPSAAQVERLSRLANVLPSFFELPDDVDPQIMVALVRGRRGCFTHVVMTGEPPAWQERLAVKGIRVTATDLEHPEDTNTVEVMDNYVLITAGTCHQTYMQVSRAKDGTQTHVITVKGIR